MAPKTTPAAKDAKVKPSTPTNGSATPTEKPEVVEGAGRPDKKQFDDEQAKIKAEIDALQSKVLAVREKISLATNKPGSGANDRRNILRTELDTLRSHHSNNKTSRTKIIEQLKSLNEGVQKKVKDLQASKSKTPFKTVAEVEAHVRHLEKQVESGNLKLAEEKRALQEISQTKRSIRIVENFQADQDAIDADRAAADALRAQLDDPESKANYERMDAIKAELDEIKKEGDEAYAGRSKLFEERDKLQAEMDVIYNHKRESAAQFREANDRYWTKVNDDRAKRAERARAQRAEEEAQKKQEVAQRLREEAEEPAHQAEIEDCQTLIDYLSGKNSGNVTFKTAVPLSVRADVAGVPKLELRKVEAAPEGLIARKKKGEEEEPTWFAGGKTKGKGKKGSAKAPPAPDANGSSTSSTQLNLPLPTLSALLALRIPPPVSTADVPRVIEDLKTKKTWYQANQAQDTAKNIAKAEAEIKRLTQGKGEAVEKTTPEVVEETPATEEDKTAAPVEETPVEA